MARTSVSDDDSKCTSRNRVLLAWTCTPLKPDFPHPPSPFLKLDRNETVLINLTTFYFINLMFSRFLWYFLCSMKKKTEIRKKFTKRERLKLQTFGVVILLIKPVPINSSYQFIWQHILWNLHLCSTNSLINSSGYKNVYKQNQ